MKRTLTLITLAAAAATTFAVSLALNARERNSALAAVAPDRSAAGAISRAEQSLRRDPDDQHALALYAVSALGVVKETADSSWYVRADDAARRALAINPGNVPALDATATLANARHRFRDAIAPATRSLRLAPDRFAPLEILTDAHIELGQYRAGFAAAAKRLELRPDLASYSRASYAAELRGEHAQATELMRLAADSARRGSGDRAWALTHVGLLEFGSGDLDSADAEMRRALREAPGDAAATAGLAKVLAAKGQLAAAADLYRDALEASPIAAVAAELAEVEEIRGEQSASRDALATAHELDQREQANGVLLDLDAAATDADFRIPTAADVAKARRGHHDRPGIIGDDALGWVLTRAGQCEEGLRYAQRSLRLGTRNALMHFHAGMAAHCAGADDDARRHLQTALDINPRFSIRWSLVATKTLRTLSARA